MPGNASVRSSRHTLSIASQVGGLEGLPGAPPILTVTMYELQVEACFSAAHAISIAGQVEPLHGHDWRVRATVQGDHLDAEGLLCDFHLVEGHLREVVSTLHNSTLNNISPFDDLNPTAEHVALHLAKSLAARLDGDLPPSVVLASVEVTEAPGCCAVYRIPLKVNH
jgi:6-pyruvoyltetrahydropterin/6-carboxytetrahydropterin synthase